MNTEAMFSSKTDLYETPQDFFDQLDAEFHFDLDVCALPENAKCKRYYTPEMDGLSQPWEGMCWCNPPYLAENEVVHHINHIRDDDRVENLMLMDKQEHWQMHLAEGFHARQKKGFKICRAKLLELYQLGMSDGKIGKALGVSKETVRYTRLRMGLLAHDKKRSKAEGTS